jgi:hypothetical protein
MRIRRLPWDENTKDSLIVLFDVSEKKDSCLSGVVIGLALCVSFQWYTHSFFSALFLFHLLYCLKQAMNFVFKDRYERMFANYNPKLNPYKLLLGNLFAGGMAGASALLFIYPLDFARTRLAVDIGKSVKDRQFKGTNDCFIKIWKADGIQGLIYSRRTKTETFICIY